METWKAGQKWSQAWVSGKEVSELWKAGAKFYEKGGTPPTSTKYYIGEGAGYSGLGFFLTPQPPLQDDWLWIPLTEAGSGNDNVVNAWIGSPDDEVYLELPELDFAVQDSYDLAFELQSLYQSVDGMDITGLQYWYISTNYDGFDIDPYEALNKPLQGKVTLHTTVNLHSYTDATFFGMGSQPYIEIED